VNRSDEVLKNLNRLTNDRSLSPQARNKILDAMRHIRELMTELVAEGRPAGRDGLTRD